MKEHFAQFCKEKMYLKSVAKETLNFYRDSFRAWERVMGDAPFTKQSLKMFVISLQERGLSVASINCYSRGINSFLSWLHENEYLTERLKITPLREELKLMPTYQPAHLKTFVSFKGKKWTEKRLHAILCVLIDTGCRISEVLNIKRDDVDFDNLLITVTGKGKQRKVPMSHELRRILYAWARTHSFPLLFPTRDGVPLRQRNVLREFYRLSMRLGVPKVHRSLHAFRHTFATEYLRNGGGELYLQRCLGHSTLTMTRRYAQISDRDLSVMHKKTSILSRLK